MAGHPMLDDVRRAYAALGLPVGASGEAIRKQYKALVKTWHPDRFAADPQGQVEAGERLRVINAAYATLARRHARVAPPPNPAPRKPGRRLTREEIDAIVAAIGSDGPLDDLFRTLGRVSAPIGSMLGALVSRITSRG